MIKTISLATGRGTIMVVDDMPANIEVIHALLSPDHEVLFATSGEGALELAAITRPDLILLDVLMPTMNGHEVCKRFKADPMTEHIPIIFVTAMGATDNEEAGLKLGAIDYIVKPYSPAVVKARIANHLDLKRHRDFLASLASIDGLTGISNRRHFDESLEREFWRAARASSPLSLIMIDIDHFKEYNDHYGHLAGDDCLKRIAYELVKTPCRPADMVFRYGGEEFACLLPDTHAAGALQLGQRLLAHIHQLAIPHAASSYQQVSLSLGVCTLIPTPNCQHEELIARADKALYRAKALGRNRLEVAE